MAAEDRIFTLRWRVLLVEDLALPAAVGRGVGAEVVEKGVTAEDAAVEQQHNAGQAGLDAVERAKLERIEPVDDTARPDSADRRQRLVVEPGVFVPRPRTEFLVQQAITLTRPGDVVVDLCCGVGAVAAAVVASLGSVELHAVDIDPVEVRCARRNLGDRAAVYEGDLYDPLSKDLRGRVDVVVANAPYVPTGEIDFMPAEARLQEPRIALDGGGDGLDVVRRIAEGAPAWLAPGGHVLVEVSERQAAPVAAAFEDAGLGVRITRGEELDAIVVIGTCWPG